MISAMMKLLRKTIVLAATVSALPQPQLQASAPAVLAVVTPEEAAAQARAAFMGDGFTAQANQIIPVVVGGTQDVFVPNVVTAAVGDVVQFQFANGNHTVTQSAQDAACQPLQATVANAVHSGHIPFQDAQTTVGTFSMPVLDTSPMFLYCATGPHCQEGQVLIINPANTQQIVDYAKLAASSGQSGDGTTVQGGAVAQIPLELAAFTPAAPQAQGPPPAAAPAQSSAAAPAPGAVLTVTLPPAAAPAATNAAGAGITTVIVTVPAAL